MKRLIALIVALLILALPALADVPTGLAYTTEVAEDGSLVFFFEDLTLRLPAEWKDKVVGSAGNNSLGFYHRANYEKYLNGTALTDGFLFRLGACVNQSYKDLPSYVDLGFCEDSCMHYYLELPTDYPTDMQEDIRAEYDAMYAQIDYIVEHAALYGQETTEPAPQTEPAPGSGNKHL
ncbi:MAG: hypothetical protein IKS52_08810 [Clostridia bacterium]|nr:hypothetical protein [Clostridia bacterium]